jgi:hypothetical protein
MARAGVTRALRGRLLRVRFPRDGARGACGQGDRDHLGGGEASLLPALTWLRVPHNLLI